MEIKKIIFVILGLLCVGLGFWGIILPGLPTTVFLLMAAYFFAKSSPRLHNWLLNNRLFGPFIKDYQKHKSIYLRTKIWAITSMTIMITISFFFLPPIWWVKGIVIGTGLIGAIVVGFVVKTRKDEN